MYRPASSMDSVAAPHEGSDTVSEQRLSEAAKQMLLPICQVGPLRGSDSQ